MSCEEKWRRVGGINRWWEEGRRNRVCLLRQTSQQLTDTKILRCGDLKPPCVSGLVYVSEEPKHTFLETTWFWNHSLCVLVTFSVKFVQIQRLKMKYY